MWLSEAWATRLYDIANITLVATLAVGVVATVLLIWTGNSKETYLRRELANSAERSANLENQAALLRWQLDQEIQKRAPRILTAAQKIALIESLRGKIASVLFVIQKDVEARSFAMQLEVTFQAAGVKLLEQEMLPGETFGPPPGLMMYRPGGHNNKQAMEKDPLYIALNKAGLFGGSTNEAYLSLEKGPLGPMLPAGQYIVYVGQKAPW